MYKFLYINIFTICSLFVNLHFSDVPYNDVSELFEMHS